MCRSAAGPSTWSVSEVVNFFARLEGEKFTRASEICSENDVDGKTLASMTREDIEAWVASQVRTAPAAKGV